jgi:hypothetical protein
MKEKQKKKTKERKRKSKSRKAGEKKNEEKNSRGKNVVRENGQYDDSVVARSPTIASWSLLWVHRTRDAENCPETGGTRAIGVVSRNLHGRFSWLLLISGIQTG